MNDSQNFLITVQGPATMLDVLEHFTKQLEERSFSILDMYYLNCQSALFLLILLEFSGFTDKNSLRKELDKVAKKYQLELLISPLTEMTIILGWIMTRLILSLLFYVVFTPIRLIPRFFGKQFLELRWDKSKESYWNFRTNEHLKKENYEKQF